MAYRDRIEAPMGYEEIGAQLGVTSQLTQQTVQIAVRKLWNVRLYKRSLKAAERIRIKEIKERERSAKLS